MAKRKKENENVVENIIVGTLDDLMGDKYAIYAKDVIQDRAIPDARDGLKPVQRRIIFDMWKTGNTIDKPHKKCAHIVGDVMGKYHPHGDSSIYEALVHLSQPWAMRYPLIDFQGNNGSIDGDGAAAFRYTEARLSALSNELVADIDKDTVDMELTFDDSLLEPSVLPARFPNLFVNGSEGIAVGVATSIPPHNLREVSDAIIYRMKHPNCTVEDLLPILPGPDFPTGGIIAMSDGLRDIYRTGRGRVTVTSKTEIVTSPKGEQQIIVSEIPYQVNKSVLVKAIDKIRHDKTIPGIDEVRDETDKEGLRIAIDLRPEAKPEAILGYLLAKTPLKTSYNAHMMAIVDDRPKTLDLLSYCDCYIQHQLDVITRRSRYLEGKTLSRLEIVEGFLKAIDVLDQVVHIIRRSNDKADAKARLIEAFAFSDPQAEAILLMPLYKLSHTDVNVLVSEKASLEKDLEELRALLSDQDKREDLIATDLKRIARTYGDARKTAIEEEEKEITIDKRDLIAKEPCYLVCTRDGYVKRSSLKSWRGSGGANGSKPGIKNGDAFIYEGLCETTDYALLFTSKGNYLYIPINEIKEAKWNDEGYHVNMLVALETGEKLVSAFAVSNFRKDLYMVLLTKNGVIKRIRLDAFPVIRRSKALSAIRLSKDDELLSATLTTGNSNLFVASSDGKASFYNENELLLSNPRTGGLKAGSFGGKEMAGLLAIDPDANPNAKILLLTDRGHTRVFLLKNIPLLHRLDKPTVLFSSFKKEPHRLIGLFLAEDKEAPFAIDAVLADGQRVDVVYADFLATPLDLYAKRNERFGAKTKIVSYSLPDSILVNDGTKSYAPPVSPLSEDPSEEKDAGENENQGAFEQISLFEDLLDEGSSDEKDKSNESADPSEEKAGDKE